MSDLNLKELRARLSGEISGAVRIKDAASLDAILAEAKSKHLLDLANHVLAQKAFLRSDFPQVIRLADEMMRLDPRSLQAHTMRISALLQLREYDHAIDAINHALEILTLWHYSWFYFNKGVAYEGLERLDESIFCYLRAIEENPDDYAAYYKILLIEAGRSDWAEILKTAEQAGERFKEKPRELVYTGVFLLQQAERASGAGSGEWDLRLTQEAKRQNAIAVSKAPEDTGALYNLACAYARTGELDEALNYLTRVIEMEKSSSGESRSQVLARSDVDFARVRNDRRFRALVGEAA